MIEQYFPPHAVFETQFIEFHKKRKKMYIKRPVQGN